MPQVHLFPSWNNGPIASCIPVTHRPGPGLWFSRALEMSHSPPVVYHQCFCVIGNGIMYMFLLSLQKKQKNKKTHTHDNCFSYSIKDQVYTDSLCEHFKDQYLKWIHIVLIQACNMSQGFLWGHLRWLETLSYAFLFPSNTFYQVQCQLVSFINSHLKL